MYEAELLRRIGAPAQTVWELLSWRGMARLAGAGFFESVEFESAVDAPGATKRLRLATGVEVRERLEWLDEAGLGYGYRLLDAGELLITNYTGEVRLTAGGPAACTVYIQCRFAAQSEALADSWRGQWRDGETAILDVLETRVAAPSATTNGLDQVGAP